MAESTVITGDVTGTSNGNVKILADDVSAENITFEFTPLSNIPFLTETSLID